MSQDKDTKKVKFILFQEDKQERISVSMTQLSDELS